MRFLKCASSQIVSIVLNGVVTFGVSVVFLFLRGIEGSIGLTYETMVSFGFICAEYILSVSSIYYLVLDIIYVLGHSYFDVLHERKKTERIWIPDVKRMVYKD